MEKRLKRFLSLAMAVLMVVTLLPANSVLAEGDAAEGGNEPAVCTGQADCPANTHEEDCLKKLADDETAKKPTDPPKPECNGLEDCAAETHTENCPKAVCADCEQLKSTCICCPDCDGTTVVHSNGCVQLCTKAEGCADGKHDAECPLYLCDTCKQKPCICSADENDDEYGVQATSTLPAYALFSIPAREEANYLESISADVGESVMVFLMWGENYNKPASIVGKTGGFENGTEFAFTNVQDMQDSLMLSFNMPDADQLYFSVWNENKELIGTIVVSRQTGNDDGDEGNEGDTGATHTCDVEGPHLFLKGVPYPEIIHEAWPMLGDAIPCTICFRNAEGADVTLSINDVTVTGDAEVYVDSEGITRVRATKLGEGAIVYNVGDVTYRLPVYGQLPAYGFYSKPDRNEKYYIDTISANVGDEVTVCLMWNTASTPPSSAVGKIGEENGANTFDCTTEVYDNYAEISFTMPDADTLYFDLMNGNNSRMITIKLGRQDRGEDENEEKAAFVMLNPELTAGFGFIDDGVIGLNKQGSLRTTYDSDYPDQGVDVSHYLFVFLKSAAANETLLDDQVVYNELMRNATVSLEEWRNSDGSDYRPTLETGDITVEGIKTKYVRLIIEPGKLGEGLISMGFKFRNTDYKVYLSVTYDDSDIEVEVGEDVNLNGILSSGDALMEYLRFKHPDQFAKYNGDGHIKLKLPSKNYKEVITAYVTDPTNGRLNAVQLIGHKDGTQMQGLVAHSKVSAVSNIDFVGTGSGTGIRHEGTGVLNAIMDCTFENYDCAIEDVSIGFTRTITGCTIKNCGTGICVNSSRIGSSMSGGFIQYFDNKFIGLETAVSIKCLPSGLTPFRTRIYDNTFLFNETDFDLENFDIVNSSGDKINFYFVRNYFGKNDPNGGSGNQLANQVRGPAKIKVDKSEVKAITNPVRKTIDATDEYWIYAGENQHAAIFNSETNSILVDGDSFNTTTNARTTDGGMEIPISIVDDQGNQIAQWTF